MNWNEVPKVDQNGIITHYEIIYYSQTLIVDSTNLSLTINHLEESVAYNISVRAYTSVGPGPYSVGIVERTFEDGKL